MNVYENFDRIRAFVLDMDGVLTDGNVLVTEDGTMLRRMNIRDGYALQLAKKNGYDVVVISGSTSDGVKVRLSRLGITDVFMGVHNKVEVLQQFLSEHNLKAEQVMYMGDDIPDLDVMQMAGVAACPADAVPDIIKISQYISDKNGGEGCVRDIIEKTLKLQNKWQKDTSTPSTL